jgi:hypothetical protein
MNDHPKLRTYGNEAWFQTDYILSHGKKRTKESTRTDGSRMPVPEKGDFVEKEGGFMK